MKKVIIDADTGVDDAIAIMLALYSEEIEVLAITCLAGNTSLDNAVRNTARVLQHCQKRVPIYRGAGVSLGEGVVPENRLKFHGDDGLGDADWSDDVDTGSIKSEHAVDALIRISKEYKGEISLITLGPLTNLALAIGWEPRLLDYFESVYVMGGNLDGTFGGLKKEYNFGCDPESVATVLKHADTTKLTVLPRDTADKGIFTKEWTRETLQQSRTDFLFKILHYRMNSDWDIEQIRLPDFMLMVAIIDPDVVLEVKDACVSIDLCSEGRGLLNVDFNAITPNITILTDISFERLQQKFMDLVKKC